MRWSGTGGRKDGQRSIASWDEDPLTMAVEAARGLVKTNNPQEVIFASTSAYFTDRQHSALMVDALNLPRSTATLDIANSRRCALSMLRRVLKGKMTGKQSVLLAAGENRKTRIGSPEHTLYGDGAVACLLSHSGGAKLIGSATASHDFLDSYTSLDQRTPYAYEARFVKETAANTILVPTIQAACEDAKTSPSDITYVSLHEPSSGTYRLVAKSLKMSAPNLADDVTTRVGDLGAAHSLFALGLAFSKAKNGDIILAAGFGSGCDALLFRVQSEVTGADSLAALMKQGYPLTDYVRFLNLTDNLDMQWGMRSERSVKGQATVLERYGRDIIGFIGGRDSHGNVQFPKTDIPINPDLDRPEELEDVCLSSEIGRVVSMTKDRLNYTPDPPFAFGLVQFDNGARVMMEFADLPSGGLKVGDQVRMRLRIKLQDKSRGFRSYFWKAVPLERPILETG